MAELGHPQSVLALVQGFDRGKVCAGHQVVGLAGDADAYDFAAARPFPEFLEHGAKFHQRVRPQRGGLRVVQAVVQRNEGKRAGAGLARRRRQVNVLDVGVRHGFVGKEVGKLGKICGAHAAPSETVSVVAAGSSCRAPL
jgi:hypothetical protein